MRNLVCIWRRELGALFLSPLAYSVLVVFLCLCGWTFVQGLRQSEGSIQQVQVLYALTTAFWLPALVAVITMRCFAEERRSGTLESLLTAPVTDLDVVLGKYAGVLTFAVAGIAASAVNLAVLMQMANSVTAFDPGGLVGAILLLLLLAAVWTAVGVTVSLMTQHQAIAGMLTLFVIVAPFVMHYTIALMPGFKRTRPMAFPLELHVLDFSRGLVDMSTVVLYLSLTWLLLFFCVRTLEARRWR